VNELPQDPESERSLLATLCAAGAEQAAMECMTVLRVEDFLTPAHKAVFQALGTVLDESGELGSLAIMDALGRANALNRAGGATGLFDILGGQEVGRPMALVEVLQRHRKRRELMALGSMMSRSAFEGSDTPEQITETAGAALSRIAMRHDRSGIQHIADFSDDALASIMDEMNGVQGKASWVKGWGRLNGMIGGFQPGLTILAARPSIGKTALALNWALGVAEYGKTVGIFSLEMKSSRLWRRLASAHAGVDIRAMIANKDKAAFNRIGEAKNELDRRGIWINDRSSITPREITGEVDGLIARQPNLGLLVVDHLGLMTSSNESKASKQNEATRIGEITRAFHNLGQDRNIPVLLLCQLNREVEKRQGGRPQLSDLRDSGRIEEDAHTVMFIHRSLKPMEPNDPDTNKAELIIAKQREGPLGDISLEFNPNLTRYNEIERSTEASTPVTRYQEPEAYWEPAV
jgi:replicative DNA helicase